MTSAVGWLCLDGLELVNCVRTLHYVKQGLAASGITGTPDGSCGCSDVDEGNYTTPGASPNPAPWYLAAEPASVEFLGFVPTSIERRPSLTRAVTTSDFGASVGPLRRGQQFVAVSATMLASTARGMEYGERWLRAVLADCGDTGELVMLPTCSGGGPSTFRTLLDVGLVDGPTFSAIQDMPEAFMQDVSFQLVSGVPYAFHDPVTVLNFADVEASGENIARTSEWTGDGTMRIIITCDATPMTNLVIHSRVTPDGVCAAVLATCFKYVVPVLPAGRQLRVDGRTLMFDVFNPATQTVEQGLDALDPVASVFGWPDIAACSTVCLSIDADTGGANAHALVETYIREP